MSIVSDFVWYAEIVDTYLLDATSTWDSTTTHNIVCPSGKRWIVITGGYSRSAAATASVGFHNVADAKICGIDVAASGTGFRNLFSMSNTSDIANLTFPLIMEAGDYIKFFFGAAQGAAAFLSLRVLEYTL